ncbi:hypothetical protein LINPERHAP2_LOCUS32847 [Linum perenne]
MATLRQLFWRDSDDFSGWTPMSDQTSVTFLVADQTLAKAC